MKERSFSLPDRLRRIRIGIRNLDPVARATDYDLVTRWPKGTRTVIHPLGAAVMCVVSPTGVLAWALGHVWSSGAGVLWISVIALLALSLLTMWAVPMGIVSRMNIRTVGLGLWVCVSPNFSFLPTVSPIVAVGDVDFGLGQDYWLGTKDTVVYREAETPEIPVVHIVDPFRHFRHSPPDIPLPHIFESLPVLLYTIEDHYAREGRSEIESAQENIVASAMNDEGFNNIQTADCVALAIRMRFAQRVTSGNLQATCLGLMWARLITGQTASSPPPMSSSLPIMSSGNVASSSPAQSSPPMLSTWLSSDDLVYCVRLMIESFRDEIENGSAGKYLLWQRDGKHVGEKAIQAAAALHWVPYRAIWDIDMSPETNKSDGHVDFKFSQGNHARTLVEFKLMSNSGVAADGPTQLSRYMQIEHVASAFYVCVGFTNAELSPKRCSSVETTCANESQAKHVNIQPFFIDARERESASKLRPSSSPG